MKPIERAAVSFAATAVFSIFVAPASVADPTANLKAEIDAARLESGCPPLQLDAILSEVSERVAHEMDDYVRHTARVLPTTGELDMVPTGSGGLLRVMRESGYPTTKAKLLIGYGDYRTGGPGDNESKAIKATVLQGMGLNVLSDCAYTKYGISAINDDSSQGWPSTAPRTYSVADAILAGA